MAHMSALSWFGRPDTLLEHEKPGVWISCSYALFGGLIGWMSWGASADTWRLLWITLLPLAWGMAETRGCASLVVLAYYLAAARAIPAASSAFFGDASPWWFGWMLWCASSMLLTIPFFILWSERVGSRPLRFVLALCVTVIPPLGLIGWTSILSVAGVLFPGTAWAGVVLSICAFAALVGRRRKWIILFCALSLVINIVEGEGSARVPASWRGADTSFPQLTSSGGVADPGQLLSALHRIDWIKDFATRVPDDSVTILPETLLGPVSGVTEFALRRTEADLAARKARILVGAEVPQADGRYKNVVLMLGARNNEQRMAVQGIPVPVSMWKPWASEGAVADIFGFGNMIEVKGIKAGVLVCYEQLLPFPFLRTMLKQPNVIVNVSNVWWAKRPDIPNIEHQAVSAFSRLFGVPMVSARNW
ncbi:MAG TPA: hypothetical protein VJ654_12880 [Noviherbaspirillum sp.]|nr:hypothetical protein [Noviherbaspirillum sp.]